MDLCFLLELPDELLATILLYAGYWVHPHLVGSCRRLLAVAGNIGEERLYSHFLASRHKIFLSLVSQYCGKRIGCHFNRVGPSATNERNRFDLWWETLCVAGSDESRTQPLLSLRQKFAQIIRKRYRAPPRLISQGVTNIINDVPRCNVASGFTANGFVKCSSPALHHICHVPLCHSKYCDDCAAGTSEFLTDGREPVMGTRKPGLSLECHGCGLIVCGEHIACCGVYDFCAKSNGRFSHEDDGSDDDDDESENESKEVKDVEVTIEHDDDFENLSVISYDPPRKKLEPFNLIRRTSVHANQISLGYTAATLWRDDAPSRAEGSGGAVPNLFETILCIDCEALYGPSATIKMFRTQDEPMLLSPNTPQSVLRTVL